jgi:hypothetical protein
MVRLMGDDAMMDDDVGQQEAEARIGLEVLITIIHAFRLVQVHSII